MRPDYQDKWAKWLVHWTDGSTAYISVVFTWLLPQAYSLCTWYVKQGYGVKAGGPAVALMPDYLSPVAECGGHINALSYHNRFATFTSRGCIRKCEFCAVPKIEGELVELDDFETKPIICDNNLLACSKRHFDKVVDRFKLLEGIDFNQGLDARLLEQHHIERLKELDLSVLRFAWDDVGSERQVLTAIEAILRGGFPKSKVRCYVLYNFHDTLDDALYRCNTLKRMGILPNVQCYQPLDTLKKNSHVDPGWNKVLLSDFGRYWSKQVWFSPIPFEEYRQRKRKVVVSEAQDVMDFSIK